MRRRDLRLALVSLPAPDELGAQRRSWRVVRAAFAEREPVPARMPDVRPLVALAAALALVAAALSPPGRAVLGDVREAIAPTRVERAQPDVIRLPDRGQILVDSPVGSWIVHRDGSKRLLGPYEESTWSPRGLHVAATAGRTLVAMDPKGRVKWTLSRRSAISDPRWAPSGYRVAYRSGSTLRVVAGDGTDDRQLARDAWRAPPAWRPDRSHVLAYADSRGRVHVVDADSGRALWATTRPQPPIGVDQLDWSADGERLLVYARALFARYGQRRAHAFRIYSRRGRLLRTIPLPRYRTVFRAAFARGGHVFAYSDFDAFNKRGRIILQSADTGSQRILFRGAGELQDVTWSPSGRWLVASWLDADQWLFIRTPGVRRIAAASNILRTFDPKEGSPPFPAIADWCCPPAP